MSTRAMFHRSLQHTNHAVARRLPIGTCKVCTCRCGRFFQRNESKPSQSRSYASQPLPPKSNPYARSLALRQRKKESAALEPDDDQLYRHLKAASCVLSSYENWIKFRKGFAELAKQRRYKTGLGLDLTVFWDLLNQTGVTTLECYWTARACRADYDTEYRAMGTTLMQTLVQAGDAFSTLLLAEETLADSRTDPNALRSANFAQIRKHLVRLGKGKESRIPAHDRFLYTVCEGRMASASGEVEYAIKLWEHALDEAVAYSKADPELIREGSHAAFRANLAPWIELVTAYGRRGDEQNARRVADIGCERDDPDSHYQNAQLARLTGNDEFLVTNAWLFHVTKAAGAGNVKAMHALGNWYANSHWPYIDNEPPDEIKPTPFDTFPPDEAKSFSSKLQSFLGMQQRSTADEKSRVFLGAAFPNTAHGRWKMAMQWLETAMQMFFAPSFLLAAHLYLQKNLYQSATAPQAAMQLKDTRYKYASKADYYAGNRIARVENQSSSENDEIPNPGYNPEKAKDLLREVFYAVQAASYKKHVVKDRTKARSEGRRVVEKFNIDYWLDEKNMTDTTSTHIKKWFRYPEVAESFMDETKGTMYDDESGFHDLETLARQYCDSNGWDIYDDDGGLLYKHDPSGKGKVKLPEWKMGLR